MREQEPPPPLPTVNPPFSLLHFTINKNGSNKPCKGAGLHGAGDISQNDTRPVGRLFTSFFFVLLSFLCLAVILTTELLVHSLQTLLSSGERSDCPLAVFPDLTVCCSHGQRLSDSILRTARMEARFDSCVKLNGGKTGRFCRFLNRIGIFLPSVTSQHHVFVY